METEAPRDRAKTIPHPQPIHQRMRPLKNELHLSKVDIRGIDVNFRALSALKH